MSRSARAASDTKTTPSGQLRRDGRGKLQGEPGLAAPAGAGQRQQAAAVQQPPQLGELALAPDKTCHWGRQASGQIGADLRAQALRLGPGACASAD